MVNGIKAGKTQALAISGIAPWRVFGHGPLGNRANVRWRVRSSRRRWFQKPDWQDSSMNRCGFFGCDSRTRQTSFGRPAVWGARRYAWRACPNSSSRLGGSSAAPRAQLSRTEIAAWHTEFPERFVVCPDRVRPERRWMCGNHDRQFPRRAGPNTSCNGEESPPLAFSVSKWFNQNQVRAAFDQGLWSSLIQ